MIELTTGQHPQVILYVFIGVLFLIAYAIRRLRKKRFKLTPILGSM